MGKSNVVPLRRRLLEIVNWEIGVNMRDAGWRRRDVQAVIRKYSLQHGQAVIFYNNSRYWFGEGGGSHPPRCRIYWMWNGIGCTCIPPVDEGNKQIDYQYKLNDWIRRTFLCQKEMLEDVLGIFDTNFGEREKRRAAAAMAARKRVA